MANTTTYTYAYGANQDTTFRTLNYDLNRVGSGINLSGTTGSITPTAYLTIADFGVLTNTTTNVVCLGLTATISPSIGNKMEVFANGTASGTCSVVFDSNFKVETSNTVSVGATKNMVANFTYNGTYWVGSAVTA